MSHFRITIKNATLTLDSATKYRFDNNICYHILLKKRFSILMWYQCSDYNMFLLLKSYDSDDTTPPPSDQEFRRGLALMDTMYWFHTPHVEISELKLIEKNNEIIRLAMPFEEDVLEGAGPWELAKKEDCLGIYYLRDETMSVAYENYVEAFQKGLTVWKPKGLVKLEWDKDG